MSQPITWRNVEAPDSRSAPKFMDGAASSVNTGFDIFNKIIQQRQAIDQSNVTALNEVGKQNYLDQLQKATTPEQLAEMQRSGALDQQYANLDPASRALVRAAQEARTTSLRTNVTAAQEYGIKQQDVRDAPVLEKAAALRAAGDTTGSDAWIAANPQLRVTSTAIAANRTEALKRVQDGRKAIQDRDADALAAATNPNLVAEQNFKTALRPTTEANAAAEARLRTTTLANQTVDADAQAIDRKLEARLAAEAGVRQQQLTTTRDAIEGVAQGFPGLPRDTAGRLVVNRMSPDQRLSLNDVLGIKGIPLVESLEGGDTKDVAGFIDKLKREGFKPTAIARLTPAISAAFNTASVSPTGNDAEILSREHRAREATAHINGLQYTAANMPGAAGASLDAAFTAINDFIPAGWENENWKKAMAKFYKDDGIMAKDPQTGKAMLDADGIPIRVLPGPDAIKQIIRSRRDFVGWGAKDLTQELTAWKAKAENQIGASKAVNDQLYNVIRGVDIPKPAPAAK